MSATSGGGTSAAASRGTAIKIIRPRSHACMIGMVPGPIDLAYILYTIVMTQNTNLPDAPN